MIIHINLTITTTTTTTTTSTTTTTNNNVGEQSIFANSNRKRLAECGRRPHRDLLAQHNSCHGPQFAGTCVKHGGVRLHRIRDREPSSGNNHSNSNS